MTIEETFRNSAAQQQADADFAGTAAMKLIALGAVALTVYSVLLGWFVLSVVCE